MALGAYLNQMPPSFLPTRHGLPSRLRMKSNHADFDPQAEAAAVTSFVTPADGELLGLTNSPIRLAAGTTSCSSPNSFTATSARGKLMPVALLPGRAKLTTRPRATGSLVTPNVRRQRRSQPVDATLYLKRKRWSV